MKVSIYDSSEEVLLMYYERYSSKYEIFFCNSEADIFITNKYILNVSNKILIIPSIYKNIQEGNAIYFNNLNELDKILYTIFIHTPKKSINASLSYYKHINLHQNSFLFYFQDLLKYLDQLPKSNIIQLILNEICHYNALIAIRILNNIATIAINKYNNKYLYFTLMYTESFKMYSDKIIIKVNI